MGSYLISLWMKYMKAALDCHQQRWLGPLSICQTEEYLEVGTS